MHLQAYPGQGGVLWKHLGLRTLVLGENSLPGLCRKAAGPVEDFRGAHCGGSTAVFIRLGVEGNANLFYGKNDLFIKPSLLKCSQVDV